MRFLSKYITGHSLTSDAIRRMLSDPWAVVSFAVIVVYTAIALLSALGVVAGDWQAEIGPSRMAPVYDKGWRYWMGLDIFGRSMLAKTLHGVQTAMYIGFMSAVLAIPIGVVLGAAAGYFGGLVDDLVVWLYTTISNIPEILLLVAIGFVLGKGINTVWIALGMTAWVSLARLIRAEVMRHKNRDYVAAAAAIGGGHTRKIFRHILPNVLHVVIITFSFSFITAIKSEVVLTYLGLGVEPGNASWGLMIDDAKGELIQGMWWGMTSATLAMFFVVLALSLFVDALRDAFDPKLRGRM